MLQRLIGENGREYTGASMIPLPLNLIAVIISHLDQPSDLARICRTCRAFHYMTLPSLYANTSLRSYDYIRSAPDGRPEGWGMASPFSIGLNGLVSRNVAGYVKNFQVHGEWKEYGAEEHAKAGRLTDGNMMLNTLVRVAVERMGSLHSFSWELNTKMLLTVWQALVQKPTLTHLTVRLSSQHQRPVSIIPPIPSLRSLKVYDIDPLCYSDDISPLLFGAKGLDELTLIWNHRMRKAHVPNVSLYGFLARYLARGEKLSLKSLVIKNLCVHDPQEIRQVFIRADIEEITFLNSFAGPGDDPETTFFAGNLRWQDFQPPPNLKMLRTDAASPFRLEMLSSTRGLERLYFVGSQTALTKSSSTGVSHAELEQLPQSPASSTRSRPGMSATADLKDAYLEVITRNHGNTLRHLLLMPQWRLSSEDIAIIVRQCPNLEQLGIGLEFGNFINLRLLAPFLGNLAALRLLDNPDNPAFSMKMKELDEIGVHEEKIGGDHCHPERHMKWMELGELLFEIGEFKPRIPDKDTGKVVYQRPVWKRPSGSANHVEIFALDSLEV